MNETFEMSDTDEVNAANPCCCPEAACVYAEAEFQHRDSELCMGGFSPYFMSYPSEGPEPYPESFDLYTTGKLVPLYRTMVESSAQVASGTKTELWEYSSGHVVSQTFTFTSTLAFEFETTVTSGYQQFRDFWPAGNIPYGVCPPEDTIFAGSASAASAIAGAAADGLVPVTLTSPEVRPEHPTDLDGDGNPLKLGGYDWRVDGYNYGSSDPELVIHLTEGDTTCHEFQVRHAAGSSYGKWSAPKLFSLSGNPCCKEREPQDCNAITTGNAQRDKDQAYISGRGETWTSAYTGGGGYAPSDSGTFGACDGTGPSNVPPALTGGIFGSIFVPRPPLYFIYATTPDSATITQTPSVRKVVTLWSKNTSSSNPLDPEEPDPAGWRGASASESGTAKATTTTTLSDDRNGGKSTIDSMFSTLRGTIERYDATYGWGITLSGGFSGDARAVGSYPETQAGGLGMVGQMLIQMRQSRFRWKVPEDHDGTAYKTKWNIGRFHDRWLTWRGEYFDWAVAKYAFLNKPKPGDDAYPKLSDFYDYPETPANEAKEQLQFAIDNLPKDPGPAPAEPKELRPEIIGAEVAWSWSINQGEQPEEQISDCDPTKYARELHEPVKPKREDYGTDEQYQDALDDYESALASYNDQVAQRKADSKRQSPWYLITPDRWSDWREKPDPVPDLPTIPTPTENDRKAHDRAVKRYDFLLSRYRTEPHVGFYLCNVRHICEETPDIGTIENVDHRYPTTNLPELDPTKEDPYRWEAWYR